MHFAFIYIAIYAVVLGAITWTSSRGQTSGDYLNGSKNLSAGESAWTTFASLLTGYNFVLGVTFAYLYGLWYLMAFVGAALAFVAFYFLYKNKFAPLQREHDLLSIGDYFGLLYGRPVKVYVNGLLCFGLLLFLILQMFVNAGLFSGLLGISNITALVLTAGVVCMYLWFGGFRASVRTDIFQGILMLPIALTIFAIPPHISVEHLSVALDPSQAWFAVGLALLQFFSLLGQAESFQRVFASRDAHSLKRGLFIAFVMLVVVAGAIAYLGINFKFAGITTDPSTLFTGEVLTAIPQWLSSLLVVSLIAAFMGTIDSSAFALGALLARMRRPEAALKSIRMFTLTGVFVSALASLYLFSFLSSVFALISLVSLVGAALMVSAIVSPSSIEMKTFLISGTLTYAVGLWTKFITENPLTALIPCGVALLLLLGVRLLTFVQRNYAVRQ